MNVKVHLPSLSRKSGKASLAIALQRSRVTSSLWCCFTTVHTALACFACSGVPPASFATSSSMGSIPSSPMVKPAIVPATPTRVREAPIEKLREVVVSCGEFDGDGEEWSLNITGQPL